MDSVLQVLTHILQIIVSGVLGGAIVCGIMELGRQ